MKHRTYIFDNVGMTARKFTRSAWTVIWGALRVFLVSLSLFVVLYLVLSGVLSNVFAKDEDTILKSCVIDEIKQT